MEEATKTTRGTDRTRHVAWAVALVVLVTAAIVLGAHPRRGIDLRVYLTAAQRFLDGTSQYRDEDGAMPFKYAPPSAMVFIPLLALPARVATVAWNLLSVAALAWTLHRILRVVPGAPALTPLVVVLALAHPLYLELHYGQVDLAMLAILWFAMDASHEERPVPAGVAIAFAALFKPPALIALGLLLLRRQWRGLGAFALAQAVLWIPVLARMGIAATVREVHAWSALVERTTAPWALGYNPQGLPTVLLSLWLPTDAVPSPHALLLVQLGAVAIFVGAVLLLRPRGAPLAAALVLGVALLSPLAWRANFVLAFPAVALAVGLRHRTGIALAVLIFLCGLLVEPLLLGDELFHRVMASLRPFAVAFSLLGGWIMWMGRAPSGSPVRQPSPARW